MRPSLIAVKIHFLSGVFTVQIDVQNGGADTGQGDGIIAHGAGQHVVKDHAPVLEQLEMDGQTVDKVTITMTGIKIEAKY